MGASNTRWTSARITISCAAVALALLATALPARAATLDKPSNIACEPTDNAGRDKVTVGWRDTSTDETAYEVHRSTDGGSFSKVADLAADATSYSETGLDTDTAYRYRARAMDGTTAGTFSDVCRQPLVYDTPQGNVRVYYRPFPTADCPRRDGQVMCVPATTNSNGDNEYAARMGGLIEDTRSRLMNLNFRDFAVYNQGKPVPVNLVWCDGGGCAGGFLGQGNAKGIGLAPVYSDPYIPATGVGATSVAVSMHEAFHLQQFDYGGATNDPSGGWVTEAQARAMQDKLCVGTTDADCINLDQINNGPFSYIGEVNGFLADPARDLTRISYVAALFWAYIMERFGTLDQEPERGFDFLLRFWEQGAARWEDTGIGTISRTLEAMGYTERFEDVFRDFVVTNVVKNLPGLSVPAKYRYIDEGEAMGPYASVPFRADRAISSTTQIGPVLDSLPAYAAKYYRFRPDATVPTLNLTVRQDSAFPIFYSLLLIDNGDLVQEIRGTGRDFIQTIPNEGYDSAVLVVAGLGSHVNYRYSLNATQPVLSIVDPVQGRKAFAGTPTAPDKILVKASLLEPDGDPVEGLDPSAFTIRIGTQTVAPDQIVASSFIQDQYWLVVQAPGQAASGDYDLTVETMGLTATENDAVTYGPRTDSDNEIVVDRSGSMADNGKMNAAKAGARLYVDTWEATDEAGLVSFESDATVDRELDLLTDEQRSAMVTAIDGLSAFGGTAIGEGLIAALEQLDARGDQDDDWSIVVLSDGMETADRRINDFLGMYQSRNDAGTKNPRVHSIALGPDADRANMQRLASDTGGTYQFASVPIPPPPPPPGFWLFPLLDLTPATAPAGGSLEDEPEHLDNLLASIYRVVSEEIAGEQQVFAGTGPIPDQQTFVVDGGARELTVAIHTDFDGFAPTLRAPDGTVVPPRRRDSRKAFWRVPSPARGTWTLDVEEDCFEFCATEYVADAAVKGALTMETFLGLAPAQRLAGRPMPIVVSLSDTGPLTGANVQVEIASPSGGTQTITLSDDGAHGDGGAGDGFYGGVYTGTSTPGDYVGAVEASGTSAAFGSFTRRLRFSFAMLEATDTDGDGLPDWWEEENGTNPLLDDATADPDADGLPNEGEYTAGTDPFDADSDDGGEVDGAETGDPLDPSDDRIAPPRIAAYAGVGQVIVRSSTEPAYTGFRVQRALLFDGPYSTIADPAPPTDEFIDTGVTNGIEYCYRLIALGGGGAVSAPSEPSCARPNTDPIPPVGGVFIDGGADVTFDLDVDLELLALDNPSPHLEHEGSAPEIEGAEASGVADMLIANDGSFDGAVWEPYQPTRTWRIAPVGETATVYAKFRDGAGNVSEPVHSSIRVMDLSSCDIVGTPGADRIVGTDASEVICGLGGADHISGGGGSDGIVGGDGNDHLDGGPGNDVLLGEAGNDLLVGGDGNDMLRGGDGNDDLRGGNGNDRLEGEAGIDTLRGDAGADYLDGGPG
ncbi:MAG TPA: VWA domain-containing protein, partial [Actinomycetota bacterium]